MRKLQGKVGKEIISQLSKWKGCNNNLNCDFSPFQRQRKLFWACLSEVWSESSLCGDRRWSWRGDCSQEGKTVWFYYYFNGWKMGHSKSVNLTLCLISAASVVWVCFFMKLLFWDFPRFFFLMLFYNVIQMYLCTIAPLQMGQYFTYALLLQKHWKLLKRYYLKFQCYTLYTRLIWHYFCFIRRTCHSGECPVGLISRLWATHWSWTTSRGRHPSHSALMLVLWETLELLSVPCRWRFPWRLIKSQYCYIEQALWQTILYPSQWILWGFWSKAAVSVIHKYEKKGWKQNKRPKWNKGPKPHR